MSQGRLDDEPTTRHHYGLPPTPSIAPCYPGNVLTSHWPCRPDWTHPLFSIPKPRFEIELYPWRGPIWTWLFRLHLFYINERAQNTPICSLKTSMVVPEPKQRVHEQCDSEQVDQVDGRWANFFGRKVGRRLTFGLPTANSSGGRLWVDRCLLSSPVVVATVHTGMSDFDPVYAAGPSSV